MSVSQATFGVRPLLPIRPQFGSEQQTRKLTPNQSQLLEMKPNNVRPIINNRIMSNRFAA